MALTRLAAAQDGDDEHIGPAEARRLLLPAAPPAGAPGVQQLVAELVGRRVRRRFNTGWFSGLIDSYSGKRRQFHITYEVRRRRGRGGRGVINSARSFATQYYNTKILSQVVLRFQTVPQPLGFPPLFMHRTIPRRPRGVPASTSS